MAQEVSIANKIRDGMTKGSDLKVTFGEGMKAKGTGKTVVYLHENKDDGILIDDVKDGGEECEILWLPWKQGEAYVINEYSIGAAKADQLFFTFKLTGCRVFGIEGGGGEEQNEGAPIWHIDAGIDAKEFMEKIFVSNDWVIDNWNVGSDQNLAYLRRAGQNPENWDLSAYFKGDPPSTYGKDNVGECTIGGICNGKGKITLYKQESVANAKWESLNYTKQNRIK